jgi:hypothetical protein
MSSKKGFWYSCVLFIAGLLSVAPSSARYPTIAQSGCQSANCPPCFKNQAPLAGSGTATDGSNRRILKVHIDSTWGNPTNENVYNRTNEAISDWNSAVDTTCNPPTQKTGYLLVLDQQAPVGSRDIEITKVSATSMEECAAHTSDTYDQIPLR